jgi:hypothetical protein
VARLTGNEGPETAVQSDGTSDAACSTSRPSGTTGGTTHEADSRCSWLGSTLCNVDRPSGGGQLKRVQAKVGELTMKLEIVEWFLEKKGYGEELRKLKRSGEL